MYKELEPEELEAVSGGANGRYTSPELEKMRALQELIRQAEAGSGNSTPVDPVETVQQGITVPSPNELTDKIQAEMDSLNKTVETGEKLLGQINQAAQGVLSILR